MPTALITGASSGIGLELAGEAARDGHDLVLVARNAERLESVGRGLAEKHGVKVTVLAKDLARPPAAAELHAELSARGIAVDVLVNNAGVGVYGFFAETRIEDEIEMIEVNVAAVTRLTKTFLRGMLERRRGWILNVASTAAFQPGPIMAVYYATKAYVLSFTEALANEISGTRRPRHRSLSRPDAHRIPGARRIQTDPAPEDAARLDCRRTSRAPGGRE